ncbi:MAG: hypothetical protein AAF797_00860 [Planctomycetota bacterium]
MTVARILTSSLFCTVVLAVTVGCQNRYVQYEGGTEGVRRPTTTGQVLEFNSVQIIDRRLQDWRGAERGRQSRILVQAHNASLTATNTVRAWATLQNRTTGPLAIQVRTTFFRRDQSPLEPPTAWEQVFLDPSGGIAAYEAFSLNTVEDVGFYYIEVKGL